SISRSRYAGARVSQRSRATSWCHDGRGQRSEPVTIIATVLIVLAVLAVGWQIDRRLGVKPQQLVEGDKPPAPPPELAGETPAVAIRTKPAQLARLRANQRCSQCRNAMRSAGDDEAVRYDDRRLIVLHFTCPDCGQKRSLYVEP